MPYESHPIQSGSVRVGMKTLCTSPPRHNFQHDPLRASGETASDRRVFIPHSGRHSEGSRMLMSILRFSQKQKSFVVLAGMILAGQTARGQFPDGGVPFPSTASRPQPTPAQATQIPPRDPSVRLAQTPQSPQGQSFSDLEGSVSEPMPIGPSGEPSLMPGAAGGYGTGGAGGYGTG